MTPDQAQPMVVLVHLAIDAMVCLPSHADHRQTSIPSLGAPSFVLALPDPFHTLPMLALVLSLVQSCMPVPPANGVWVVTCGSSTPFASELVRPSHAGSWGLCRTARTEAAALGVRCADAGAKAVRSIPNRADVLSRAIEAELALRNDSMYTPRLMTARPSASDQKWTTCKMTQLLTGGTGGLGLLTAGWLAEISYQPHLVLVSRSGVLPVSDSVRLSSGVARVAVERCDAAEPSETRRLMAWMRRSLPPLRGVWHTAGVLADGLLAVQDTRNLHRVFGAKACGAVNLQGISAAELLASCVLFSSVAGLVGGGGQANYAAANTFLDALAVSRKAQGRNASSVEWGPWAEVGMASGGAIRSRMSAMGLGLIDPWQGLAALEATLAAAQPAVVAFWLARWEVMLKPGSRSPSLLQDLAPRAAAAPAATVQIAAPIATVKLSEVLTIVQNQTGDTIDADAPLMDAGLDSLGAVELRNQLQVLSGSGIELSNTLVFDHPTARQLANLFEHSARPTARPLPAALTRAVDLSEVLEMIRRTAGSEIDADSPLMEAGLDSLGAVELRNLLDQATGAGAQLPNTLIFDHPTARGLDKFFQSLSRPRVAGAAMRRVGVVGGHGASRSVTIPSLSAVLPARVTGSQSVQHMMLCAIDTVTKAPAARWDSPYDFEEVVIARMNHGGFMHGSQLFDHSAFGIGSAEVAVMNPLQRLLLEHSYQTLHACGERRSSLLSSTTAVFVGAWAGDYERVIMSTGKGRSIYALSADAAAVMVGRLSFILGLQGPCTPMDTACSASLVACHGALRAIQLAECDASVIGGVNMMFTSSFGSLMAMAGMTSAAGRSFTFDKRADGYARGEAVTMGTMIVPNEDGVQCKFELCGSAVRQDGKSASLTAPSGQAQQALLHGALSDAACEPDELTLHQAHGTGTGLGDPIETGSLAAAVLSVRTPAAASLRSGGVKASIGHAEPGAAMTGTAAPHDRARGRCSHGKRAAARASTRTCRGQLVAVAAAACLSASQRLTWLRRGQLRAL